MGQFVVGMIQGMRSMVIADKVADRNLDIHVEPNIQLDVYDSLLATVPLVKGASYDLLILPSPYRYALEESHDPTRWSSQVLAVDWEIPLEQFTHIYRKKTAMPRLHPDYLLAEAPFGRFVLSYSSLYTMAHITHDQIAVGTPVSWEKTAGFSLRGIV